MGKILIIATFCLLGVTLIKAAITKDEVIKMVLAKIDECKSEVTPAQSDIDELLQSKAASTKEGKCLRFCLSKKFGGMDANGKPNKAGALEKAKMLTDNDPEKMKIANEIIDICAAVNAPADPCEASEVYAQCFKDQYKAKGITAENI